MVTEDALPNRLELHLGSWVGLSVRMTEQLMVELGRLHWCKVHLFYEEKMQQLRLANYFLDLACTTLLYNFCTHI
jgi:hypothetical protein